MDHPLLLYPILAVASFLSSGLTLFSGFGLGVLLLPVFALFFPVDLAVAMTAIVHFCNNLFKLLLVGRGIDRSVVLRFGAPALLASFAGAFLLARLSAVPPLFEYVLGDRTFQVTPLKLLMAALLLVFASFEALPALAGLTFPARFLPLGGALSGFFGGLSGHQGALRSAFLLRAGLTRESYIATGVALACLVDLARLSVYAAHFRSRDLGANAGPVIAATLFAFAGAFLGARLVKKVTLKTIQRLVAVMLALVAVLLGAGIL